jgi:hypothetical protein
MRQRQHRRLKLGDEQHDGGGLGRRGGDGGGKRTARPVGRVPEGARRDVAGATGRCTARRCSAGERRQWEWERQRDRDRDRDDNYAA